MYLVMKVKSLAFITIAFERCSLLFYYKKTLYLFDFLELEDGC